jgi:hypothetical protein
MDMPNLGILSYKMSTTTLEDVFHNINKNYENFDLKRDSLMPKTIDVNRSISSDNTEMI